MRALYIDCGISGISGDMLLGGLADLGADLTAVEQQIKQFPIESFSLEQTGVMKKGIYAQKVDVISREEVVHHRHYSAIKRMIVESDLSEKVKTLSLQIFEPIAEAEATIHHTSVENVHFHEVGAVDSIVDIVGTALALEQLDIEEIVSSSVVLGNGKMKMAHGMYPIPAPATMEIIKGLPIRSTEVEGELTTPTGAGILKGLVSSFGPLPSLKISKVGYGAGTKDFAHHPNVLRLIVGEKI